MLPTGRPRPATAGLGLAVGFGLLVLVAVLAWTSLDDPPDGISTLPTAALVLLVIPTFVIVTAEFRIVAAILGVEVPVVSAARVTVIGTAANVLPLPGAALTRAFVLTRRGASTAAATQALIATAGLWLGLGFAATALGLASPRPGLAAACGAMGLGGVTIAAVMLRRLGAGLRQLGALTAVEVALTLSGAVRMWLAFNALSIDGSFVEVAALTVASPASSAVGIVPAGLGIREAFAAGLGSLSGVGAAASGLATSFDRAIGLLVLVPIGGFVARRQPAEPA